MHWDTTTTLLQRLHDFDDDSAWRRVNDSFWRPVYDFARTQGLNYEDASDVAQETLSSFARRYSGEYDRGRGLVRRWMFAIAFWEVQSVHRRIARRGRQRLFLWPVERDEVEKSWQDAWDWDWWHHALKQIRRSVAPSTYWAFHATAIEQRRSGDVALDLDMTSEAVRRAKHRVIKLLEGLRSEA